ncbi:MAG: hypothetical protein AB7T63_08000 [Planctomycetota bacterium]
MKIRVVALLLLVLVVGVVAFTSRGRRAPGGGAIDGMEGRAEHGRAAGALDPVLVGSRPRSGARDLVDLLSLLIGSTSDGSEAAIELEERIRLGVVHRVRACTLLLERLQQDLGRDDSEVRNVFLVEQFLLRLDSPPPAFAAQYGSYAAEALKRAASNPHHQLVARLGDWPSSELTALREALTSASTAAQVARSLDALLKVNPALAQAAVRAALPLWLERRTISTLFPAVLEAMTRDAASARALAETAMDVAAEFQEVRDSGTADGLAFLGSATIQWMSSSSPEQREAWIDSLHTRADDPMRRGAGMYLAMSLGGASDGDLKAVARLRALCNDEESPDVARTALVNLGNVTGLDVLERASPITPDRVPASHEDILLTISYFSAVRNVLARHPEDEERAAELYVMGLRALAVGSEPELGLDALLRFLLERPVAGTEQELNRLAHSSSPRIAALAKRALDRARAGER